jgi:2-dehydropantoate 2-reductase
MRVLVVGAGATGGYFGARLAAAGRDVTFLVRPRRATQLRSDGLRVVSPHGDLTLTAKLITADEVSAPFDVVILAVKAYALEQSLTDLGSAVGPDTMIMPLLNGMRHIDMLIARFGEASVLGGTCIIASTVDAEGRIVQLAEMQELNYGERSGAMSERVQALDAVMQGASFKARVSGAIVQEMWEKWIMLATLGGITCLMRGTIGDIEAVPGGVALTLRLLAECSAVAAASGYAPREAFTKRATAMFTAKGSQSASSMYRDLQNGAAVEAEHIAGDMLARATLLGVSAPVLEIAVAHLRVYVNRLAAKG